MNGIGLYFNSFILPIERMSKININREMDSGIIVAFSICLWA